MRSAWICVLSLLWSACASSAPVSGDVDDTALGLGSGDEQERDEHSPPSTTPISSSAAPEPAERLLCSPRPISLDSAGALTLRAARPRYRSRLPCGSISPPAMPCQVPSSRIGVKGSQGANVDQLGEARFGLAQSFLSWELARVHFGAYGLPLAPRAAIGGVVAAANAHTRQLRDKHLVGCLSRSRVLAHAHDSLEARHARPARLRTRHRPGQRRKRARAPARALCDCRPIARAASARRLEGALRAGIATYEPHPAPLYAEGSSRPSPRHGCAAR